MQRPQNQCEIAGRNPFYLVNVTYVQLKQGIQQEKTYTVINCIVKSECFIPEQRMQPKCKFAKILFDVSIKWQVISVTSIQLVQFFLLSSVQQ